MISNQLTDSTSAAKSAPLSSPQAEARAPSASSATPVRAVAPQAASAPAAAPAHVDSASLSKSVETINNFLQPHAGNIEFSVDDNSGKTLLKIVDTETNTVLMQIPSKAALAMSQDLGRTKGFLIKDTA